jgi:hypothetical protein
MLAQDQRWQGPARGGPDHPEAGLQGGESFIASVVKHMAGVIPTKFVAVMGARTASEKSSLTTCATATGRPLLAPAVESKSHKPHTDFIVHQDLNALARRLANRCQKSPSGSKASGQSRLLIRFATTIALVRAEWQLVSAALNLRRRLYAARQRYREAVCDRENRTGLHQVAVGG